MEFLLSIIISVTGKISQVFISHPALCNKILHYKQHQTIFSCLTYTCTDPIWLVIINIFQSVAAPQGHVWHAGTTKALPPVCCEQAAMQAQGADGFGSIRAAKQTKPHYEQINNRKDWRTPAENSPNCKWKVLWTFYGSQGVWNVLGCIFSCSGGVTLQTCVK